MKLFYHESENREETLEKEGQGEKEEEAETAAVATGYILKSQLVFHSNIFIADNICRF